MSEASGDAQKADSLNAAQFSFVDPNNLHPSIAAIKQSLISSPTQLQPTQPQTHAPAQSQPSNEPHLPVVQGSQWLTTATSNESIMPHSNLIQQHVVHQQQQHQPPPPPQQQQNTAFPLNIYGQQQQAQQQQAQQQPQQTSQLQQQQHQQQATNTLMVTPSGQQILFGTCTSLFNPATSATQQQQQQTINHPQQQPQTAGFFNVQPHQLFAASGLNLPASTLIGNVPMQVNQVNQVNHGLSVQTVQSVQPVQTIQTVQTIQPLQSLSSAPSIGTKRKAADMTTSQKTSEEDNSHAAVSASSSSGTTASTGGIRTSTTISNPAFQIPAAAMKKQNRLECASQTLHNNPNLTRQKANSKAKTTKQKKKSKTTPDKPLEQMTPEERRRHERNVREQQRSQKISQQIKELRKVLTDSKVPFKQNKFSILMSVVDYIKELQNRASLLENEHHKLVNTIQQTSEMINSGAMQRIDNYPNVGNDAEMLYVQGIDYKAIFEQCCFPIGVAALDGRFLLCNAKFQKMTGFSKNDLGALTIFGLLATEDVDEVFKGLGTLLKNSSSENLTSSSNSDTNGMSNGGGNENGESADVPRTDNGNVTVVGAGDAQSSEVGNNNNNGENNRSIISRGYWSGNLSAPHEHIRMNISVTKTSDGKPKFFNCSLSLDPLKSLFEPNDVLNTRKIKEEYP